eukprot:gene9573-12140_t
MNKNRFWKLEAAPKMRSEPDFTMHFPRAFARPAALGIALVVACGVAAAQDSGTLRKIKDSGTIQIGS